MDKLIPLEFRKQRIMTTKILSEEFGTEEKNIQMNFSNNYTRFKAGIHYFKLEGEALKDFKRSLPNDIGLPLKYASSLILWTEKGAARHAKILDTEEAWEVYEQLEEVYFRVKEQKALSPMQLLDLQYQALKEQGEEISLIKEDVAGLKDIALTMNVSGGQAQTLKLLVEKRVKTLCCGNESNAYLNKGIRKRVYSYVWRSLKEYFNVTLYHNILRKDFLIAQEYISKITLQGSLLRDVQEENNKLHF